MPNDIILGILLLLQLTGSQELQIPNVFMSLRPLAFLVFFSPPNFRNNPDSKHCATGTVMDLFLAVLFPWSERTCSQSIPHGPHVAVTSSEPEKPAVWATQPSQSASHRVNE